jgi:hypothetical protein
MLCKEHACALQRISTHKSRAFSDGLHITCMSCCFKHSLFLSIFDACSVGSCPHATFMFDVGGDGFNTRGKEG